MLTLPIYLSISRGYSYPKWTGSTTDYVRPLNRLLNDSAFYAASNQGWDKDMQSAVTKGNYYTFIVGENTTANNNMSVLETTYLPVTIVSVKSDPVGNVPVNMSVTITVTLNKAKGTSEHVFVRWSNDGWATSAVIEVTSFNASFSGSIVIPAQTNPCTVSYYAFTSNQVPASSDSIDFVTININNNDNLNYSYDVLATSNHKCYGIVYYPYIKMNVPMDTVKVYLETTAGEVLQTTVSDSVGNYTFNNVSPGEYLVNEVIKRKVGGINPNDALYVNRCYIGGK